MFPRLTNGIHSSQTVQRLLYVTLLPWVSMPSFNISHNPKAYLLRLSFVPTSFLYTYSTLKCFYYFYSKTTLPWMRSQCNMHKYWRNKVMIKMKKKVLRNSYLSAEKQSLTRVTTKTVHCWFFLRTEMEIPCFWNNRPYKSPHQEIIGKMHFPCFKCVLSPWDHMPNCFDILQETKISSNICLAFP